MAAEEVVGGIVGFLRLDAADFHREITRAIAEVKVLKGMDARVKVEAVGAAKASREIDKVSKSALGVQHNVGGMNKSFRGLMSPQLIVGGLAAGMALLGPATAAASAAAAGFVGVLGTGILAYQGFQNEIEEGTALGQAMQSEIDGLGVAFTGLGTSAARAMSGEVLTGMRDLRAFLPSINGDVEELADHLGRAFSVGTGGVISGLKNAMPLLQDGGRYAEIMAEKFAEFTASQSFKEFVDYARQALPDVASNVSDLVIGLGKITVALAPVGDQLVALIGFFGQLAEAAAPVVGFFAQANKFTIAGVINSFEDWVGLNNAAMLAVDEHSSKVRDLALIQSPLATALGTTNAALAASRDKQRDTAQAAKDTTLAMQLENDAAGILKQTLDALNGEAISAAQAQNSFESSLVTMGDHTTKTGKKIKFTTTSITDMSAASVALRGQLNSQVSNLQRVVEANGGLSDSTGKAGEQMVTMRKQIIDNAVAHGVDKDAVTAYIDKIMEIPKSVPPTKLEVETAPALAQIKAFQKAIDSLHGKTVTAGVRYVYTGTKPTGGRSTAGGQTFADGGEIRSRTARIPGYANGTIVGPGTGKSDSILAGIAGTGELIRVSNGEFISTDASRKRNRAALEAGNKGATLGVAGGAGAAIDYARLGQVIASHASRNDTTDARVMIDKFISSAEGGRAIRQEAYQANVRAS